MKLPNSSSKWYLPMHFTIWAFLIGFIFFIGELAEQEEDLNVEKSCLPSNIFAPCFIISKSINKVFEICAIVMQLI